MKEMSLEAIASETASSSPAPGGGSVAALSGALAASLVEMAANLTIKSKKYTAVHKEMDGLRAKALGLRLQLLDDIQRDTDSFNTYMDAVHLPKGTEEEIQRRRAAMQAALRGAALVPLGVAKNALEILSLCKEVVLHGNAAVITDSLSAALTARSAALAALLNVKINLGAMQNQEEVQAISLQVRQLEEKIPIVEKEILDLAPDDLKILPVASNENP